LDEQWFIFYENFPKDYSDYSTLSSKIVLTQIYKQYKLKKLEIHKFISIPLHMKDDIDINEELLRDIYFLDDDEEKYIEKKITLNELEKSIELFFDQHFIS